MMKNILTFIFAITLCAGAPAIAKAACNVEIIEQEQQISAVVIGESTLRVTGANGQMLYVYNLAGVRIQSFRVEGNDRSYDFNLPKGCYIIKIGKVVRKISIK